MRHLRYHRQKQGIRCNVERHAKEHIATAQIHLQGEFPLGDEELEKDVARRQRHLLQFARIPGSDDVSAAVRVLLDLRNNLGELVLLTILRSPLPPLDTVNPAELSIAVPCIGIRVPYVRAEFLKLFHPVIPAEKP